jgi:hypothetical protein
MFLRHIELSFVLTYKDVGIRQKFHELQLPAMILPAGFRASYKMQGHPLAIVWPRQEFSGGSKEAHIAAIRCLCNSWIRFVAYPSHAHLRARESSLTAPEILLVPSPVMIEFT